MSMKDTSVGYIGITLSYLASFFMDITPLLLSVGALILFDTITGIAASRKRGELIEYRKGGRILAKILLYPCILIVSKVCEDYLAPDIPWMKVATGIIAAVEMKSIYENVSDALGYDLWRQVKDIIWKQRPEFLKVDETDTGNTEKTNKDKKDE